MPKQYKKKSYRKNIWGDLDQYIDEQGKYYYDKLGGEIFFGGPYPDSEEHEMWKAGRDHVYALSRAGGHMDVDEGVTSTPQKPGRKFVGPKSEKPLFKAFALPEKKPSMKTFNSINNQLVGRSAKSVKGKVKVKKSKKIRVPRILRQQVKEVLTSVSSIGSYTTIKCGFIGTITNTGTPGSLDGDDLDKTQPQVLFNQSNGIPGRTFFNQLVDFIPAGTSAIVPGAGLNYFTPAKILDAASVLFNNKLPTPNPYVTNGNLSTYFTANTGVPATVSGKLKINVLSSKVQFSMKNVSNRVVTCEIWECCPKLKFQPTNPLATLQTLINGLSEVTSDTNFSYYLDATTPGLSNQCHFDPAIEPFGLAAKFMGYKFTWRKRTMVLAPDETCVHSLEGPKGVFDYSNLFSVSSADPPVLLEEESTLYKNWSVGVVMAISGDQVRVSSGKGGRKLYTTTAGALACPIAVEIQEQYRISVPEIAGFVTADGAAGTVQSLNMRKPRVIVYNQIELGSGVYAVSNEVNPLLEVANDQLS